MDKMDSKIIVGLHRQVKELDKRTLAIAREYGLSFSQFMVLEALYSKGNLTISEVRDSILSSVGTISLIVKNLENMAYIRRLCDEDDKRVSILELTEEGRSLIKKIIPKNNEMIGSYLSPLSLAEKEKLIEILKKIGENDGK